MARTYWQKKGDAWEFLGAFQDGHKATAKQPQGVKGIGVLDIPDRGVEHFQALNEGRESPLLLTPPKGIMQKFSVYTPASCPWAQVEGFVR